MNLRRINFFLISFLIILLSTFLALFIFEIFLRIENYSKPYEKIKIEIFGRNYFFQKHLSNNEIEENKKNNFYVIGDSFVEGSVCASKNENITGHLAKTIKDYKVYNLGVGGKDPSHYIDFINFFPINEGDIVAVVLYDNDVHISNDTCSIIMRQKEIFPIYVPNYCKPKKSQILGSKNENFEHQVFIPKDQSGKNFLLKKINYYFKNLFLFRLFKESLYNFPFLSKYFYREEFKQNIGNFDSEENKWLISSIIVTKKQVEEFGAKFYLYYYPNTNKIEKEDPRHDSWRLFARKLFIDFGIKLNDPYPFFIQKSKKTSMVWSLTDKHPNCEAHKIMASYIEKITRE